MGRPWSDTDEEQARRETLGRVIQGLAARCTGGIFLAYSDLGIDGVEQKGRLLRAISVVLRKAARDG